MIPMSSEIRINVRTTAEIKRDIEVTARLKGLTLSSLINFLAVQAIREEKERDPQAFEQKVGELKKISTGQPKPSRKIQSVKIIGQTSETLPKTDRKKGNG